MNTSARRIPYAVRFIWFVGVIITTELPSNAQVQYLDQGWSAELREQFYYQPQGSLLIPYDWFLALERTDSDAMFASPAHMAEYGFLNPSGGSTPLNPDALPVGFTREPSPESGGAVWLGMTCAACHTNDIIVNGQTLRIDGAPGMADIDSFLKDLSAAVSANLFDVTKFRRLATRQLGHEPSDVELAKFRSAYQPFATTMAGQIPMRVSPRSPGPGRLDALGNIINALAVFDLGVPENYRPPNAPVSFPFLWLTPRLEWVQWNPVASSPIARNAGEVFGVFGKVNLRGTKHSRIAEFETLVKDLIPSEWDDGTANAGKTVTGIRPDELFRSTAIYPNLLALERWIDDLKPPAWDDDLFGAIDVERAARGALLFQRDCRGCHNMPPFDMTLPEENVVGKQFIKVGRFDYKAVGTDPLYVESLNQRYVATGPLGPILFNGKPFVPAGTFFLGTVATVVEHDLNELHLSPKEMLAYNDFRFYPAAPGKRPKPYKARSASDLKAGPMIGMWATGPFFHNGSVPNLYEVLSPPEERSKVFWVGSTEIDMKRLGFRSDEQPGLFRFDTAEPGNGNMGHVYPHLPYSHEERMAVVEYLKDPTRFEQ